MKKTKRLSVVILMLAMFFNMIHVTKANAASKEELIVPKDAIRYAVEHYRDYFQSAVDCFNTTIPKTKDARIGIPFVIYSEEEQDEIYYFPILDKNEKTVVMMCVIGTKTGWRVSFSSEWIKEIEESRRGKDDELFLVGDRLVSESDLDDEGGCSILNVDGKIPFVLDKPKLKKVDTENIEINDMNRYPEYMPGFTYDNENLRICNLYFPCGQGKKPICWAASAATICNYRTGEYINADQFKETACGNASLTSVKNTMQNYGIYYPYIGVGVGDMAWNTLKKNIKNRFPIYIGARGPKKSHAIVNHGYAVNNGKKYVHFWNPGINYGLGDSVVAEYNSKGTSFAYNNSVYTWQDYIARYRD